MTKLDEADCDRLRESTLRLFRLRSKRGLTVEDARQIGENLAGFFGILAEWTHPDATIPSVMKEFIGKTDDIGLSEN